MPRQRGVSHIRPRMTDDFPFLDPGRLKDGDLRLFPARTDPADPSKGYVPAYGFDMLASDGTIMGYLNLRIGDGDTELRYPGNVGYGVQPSWQGHGYAARSLNLILPFARRHGLTRLFITCQPDNIASRKTCERVGATLIEIVDIPPTHEMARARGIHRVCRYCIEI